MKHGLTALAGFSLALMCGLLLAAQQPVHRFIDIGHARLNVVEWLPSAGAGELIIALPGGGGDYSRYKRIAPLIEDAGYHIVVVNQRGIMGSTGHVADLTLKDLADDVIAIADAMNTDRFHMMGWAFGNRTARMAATLYPDRILSVSLIAGGGLVPALTQPGELGQLLSNSEHAMERTMIKLQSIEMSYPVEQSRVSVLKNVNLEIPAGESVAVIGPSGSGKTTLLLLLAGLDHPDTGTIEIQGTRLDELSADELADLRRDRLGIVFQSFHLIPSLTALGNVTLPLEIAGDVEADAKARDMLQRVGLSHRESHYPMQLSGGEQQRVAIARALVHAPPLILADEPTGNLDKGTGSAISELLFDLHDNLGSTLVMVTHDESLAMRCDRQLRLDGGALVEGRVHAFSA